MDSPRESTDADELAARRRRREWIKAHHPDQGGDPGRFIAGLAGLDTPAPAPSTAGRPTVYRSRSPWRRARRMARAVRQYVTHEPPSRRLL